MFPFRTQKLSSHTLTIFGWRRPEKIRRCHQPASRLALLLVAIFFIKSQHKPYMLSRRTMRDNPMFFPHYSFSFFYKVFNWNIFVWKKYIAKIVLTGYCNALLRTTLKSFSFIASFPKAVFLFDEFARFNQNLTEKWDFFIAQPS